MAHQALTKTYASQHNTAHIADCTISCNSQQTLILCTPQHGRKPPLVPWSRSVPRGMRPRQVGTHKQMESESDASHRCAKQRTCSAAKIGAITEPTACIDCATSTKLTSVAVQHSDKQSTNHTSSTDRRHDANHVDGQWLAVWQGSK
jgi:hypothetical protein